MPAMQSIQVNPLQQTEPVLRTLDQEPDVCVRAQGRGIRLGLTKGYNAGCLIGLGRFKCLHASSSVALLEAIVWLLRLLTVPECVLRSR